MQPGGEEAVAAVLGDDAGDGRLIGFRGGGAQRQRDGGQAKFEEAIAASAKTDQTAIARIVAEHGRDGFLTAWLHHRDVGWAADLVPTLSTQGELT